MARPLVSLCMIACDERELLPRCLDSARRFVDEIVLVDCGSKDDTAGIARARGARVVLHTWSDDFSRARNAGLDAASGRFALVLDADEWIEEAPDAQALRAELDAGAAEAWSVRIEDRLDAGATRSFPLVRLFRLRPEHRYRGTIHEQITPSIAERSGLPEVHPRPSGLVVGHDGYLARRVASRDKTERNRRILRKRIEADPEDTVARLFLVRELVAMRGGRAVPGPHLEEAIEQCERAGGRREALAAPLACDLTRLHAAALIAVGREEDARRTLDRWGWAGPCCELLLAEAEIALAGGDRERIAQAVERIQRSFDVEETGLPYLEAGLATSVARTRAAEALLTLGRREEARELAELAARLPGSGAAPWNVLALAALEEGDSAAALRLHLEGLKRDPHDPWAWDSLARTLLEQGAAGEARDALARAEALVPGWGNAACGWPRAAPEPIPDSG